jgi:hypothetical protein
MLVNGIGVQRYDIFVSNESHNSQIPQKVSSGAKTIKKARIVAGFS